MAQTTSIYKQILAEEFARRTAKNPKYSLRAMAKALEVEPGALSQILSGKRIPSYKMSQQILKHLELSPELESEFLNSIATAHQSRGLERINPAFKEMRYQPAPRDLNIELFRIIGDWYHYAILFLTYVDGFRSDARWIASQLSISEIEAKLAIERLISCGLLIREKGKLKCWENSFTTADKQVTTAALRRHQRQILEKAVYSLENDPIDVRSHSSMTMAIDPSKINEAKKLIEDFTNKLSGMLESGTRSHVYELSLCLFPLQKIDLKNTKNLQEDK